MEKCCKNPRIKGVYGKSAHPFFPITHEILGYMGNRSAAMLGVATFLEGCIWELYPDAESVPVDIRIFDKLVEYYALAGADISFLSHMVRPNFHSMLFNVCINCGTVKLKEYPETPEQVYKKLSERIDPQYKKRLLQKAKEQAEMEEARKLLKFSAPCGIVFD